MDFPVYQQLPKTCVKHNQPIILVDSDPEKGTFCFVCIQNMTRLISPNQLLKQQQELIDQTYSVNNQEKQQLQNTLDALLNYQKNFNLSLNKIIQVIKDQIEATTSFTKQVQMIIQSETIPSLSTQKINIMYQNRLQNNIEIRSQVKQYLQRFQTEYGNIDKLLNLLDDQQQKNELKDSSMKKLQYELLKDLTIKEEEYCYAFAFNKEGNILILTRGKVIIIYQFVNGQMTKELQRLTNHTDDVFCLYYMKNSNSFVSGSDDNSIIIWELDNNNSYQPKFDLNDHKDDVMCILMNKSEDLLISGSNDNSVKFWIKINNKWSCKQTIDTKYNVYSISLNEHENKLISCGQNSPISIIQLLNDNTWSLVQTIQACEYGNRLTFVKGNQFIYQPLTKDFIELYNFNEKQKQFEKLKEIEVQSCPDCEWLFPCQYIQQLNILTVKHGNFLNIFRINEEEDYQLIQTIDFGDSALFGRLSDDGKFLTTWDYQSKKIQIRGLKYLNII